MQIQSSTPHAFQAFRPLRQPVNAVYDAIAGKMDDQSLDGFSTSLEGLGAGAIVNTAAAAYPSIWAHEMGHAVTANALYEGANATVEVNPFKGGVTRWTPGPLTELGETFGSNNARGIVSAAGTIVDMGIAATTFGTGFKIRKKHPIVGGALMGYGAMTVVNSIAYAATAVGGDMAELAAKGNDFASLSVQFGIHPIASIAMMGAMLPLEYALLKALEKDDTTSPKAHNLFGT